MNQRPRLGSAAVVRLDERILLGRRGKHPNKNTWTIPGGKVEYLESLEDTVKRELMEEANITINLKKQIGTYEIIDPPHIHRVIVVWEAEYVDSDVKAGSDLLEAMFFTKEEARPLLKSPITVKILQDIGWLMKWCKTKECVLEEHKGSHANDRGDKWDE